MQWHHPELLPVLDAWQRGFPLVSHPFAAVAAAHGYDEARLLADLHEARQCKVLGRVGGVFAPNTVGASTLAAVAVPPAQVEQAAACINRHPEVNHNYQREHHYNIWFVVAAPDAARLQQVLAEVAAELQTDVLDLPLQAEYHVDLGFSLRDGAKQAHRPRPAPLPPLNAVQRKLVHALGHGLALVPQPFGQMADAIGTSEEQVLQWLREWTDAGVLRRLGFIVRHHELGYTANAMCVWQVPLEARDRIGLQLARHQGVHLCYGRPGRGAHWPYNLFCMVHGKNRDAVLAHVRALATEHGLDACPHACLFSTRRFKQTGALYGASNAA